MKMVREVYTGILDHARAAAPHEACGYLAERNGVMLKMLELHNADRSGEHFSFDPREQFAAVRAIRALGMRAAAVYHSHPATPARPSDEDIRLAFDPDISYVVASLAGPEPVVRSFRIADGAARPELLEIID